MRQMRDHQEIQKYEQILKESLKIFNKKIIPITLVAATLISSTGCSDQFLRQNNQNVIKQNVTKQIENKQIDIEIYQSKEEIKKIEQRALKAGMSGDDVLILQCQLTMIGLEVGDLDGAFGKNTRLSVLALQRYSKISVDGVVGEETRSKLETLYKMITENEISKEHKDLIRKNLKETQQKIIKEEQERLKELEMKKLVAEKENDLKVSLKLGSKGQDVTKLHSALSALGYYSGQITDEFTSQTQDAVKTLQRDFGINPSGIYGKDTKDTVSQVLNDIKKPVDSQTVNYELYESIINKNSLIKAQVEKIKPIVLEKFNLSLNEITKDDLTMICYGIVIGIDDNVYFGAVQWMMDVDAPYNNYYFTRSKCFTDAVFTAFYTTTTAVAGANAIKSIADAGAAGAFAIATAGTGAGAVVGGAVLTKECVEAVVAGITTAGSSYMFSRSVNNLKSSAQKVKQVKEPKRLKYQDISDDVLDYMEQKGGHTIDRHVSKTADDLKLRVKREDVNAATSFNSKSAATRATKENLQNNIKKINEWLGNPNSKNVEVFTYSHNCAVGYGVKSTNASKIVKDLNVTQVVLVKDSSSKVGFIIKTIYPVLK